jgi:hypothetical protein
MILILMSACFGLRHDAAVALPGLYELHQVSIFRYTVGFKVNAIIQE